MPWSISDPSRMWQLPSEGLLCQEFQWGGEGIGLSPVKGPPA